MDNQTLDQIIQQAADEQWTELDLSNRGIETWPPIGCLTHLTNLNLCWNRLTTLPAEIGLLTNLTTLDLSHNRLPALPAEIGQLTHLTSLTHPPVPLPSPASLFVW